MVRVRSIVLFVILLGLVAPGANLEAVEPKGHVFILTDEIQQPWNFTGIGEDTLRLNGVPFFPTRRKLLQPIERVPPEIVEKLRVRTAGRHELGVRAVEAIEKQDSMERKIQAAVEVYLESSLVDTVGIISESSFRVYWIGGGEVTKAIPFEQYELRSKRDIHKELIESFWNTMEWGRLLIIFSSGHKFSCPARDVDDSIRVIERLKKGQEVPEALLNNSCFRNRIVLGQFRALLLDDQ